LLTGQPEAPNARWLMESLTRLTPTALDKTGTRHTLLRLLASHPDPSTAVWLMHCLAQLGPAVQDLTNCHTWAAPPTADLLAAVRQNSHPAAWLDALPSLSWISE
jgi:hypothetical protein